tara:strand:+ start:62 stop:490 length:429 start_codon:yes stop_codon:yes gene_type:complete
MLLSFLLVPQFAAAELPRRGHTHFERESEIRATIAILSENELEALAVGIAFCVFIGVAYVTSELNPGAKRRAVHRRADRGVRCAALRRAVRIVAMPLALALGWAALCSAPALLRALRFEGYLGGREALGGVAGDLARSLGTA